MPVSRNVAAKRLFSREMAATQQIEMAIRHLEDDEFACAITLALAAEEQLPWPSGDTPHLLGVMRASETDKQVDVNKVRNWLKHNKEPDEIGISEFDVVVALIRATTKFHAVYGKPTLDMKKFLAWVKQEGFYDAEFVPSQN